MFIYSANCPKQFLWQMYFNPMELGARFLASLKVYRGMSDRKPGQGECRNGTGQGWSLGPLFTLYYSGWIPNDL